MNALDETMREKRLGKLAENVSAQLHLLMRLSEQLSSAEKGTVCCQLLVDDPDTNEEMVTELARQLRAVSDGLHPFLVRLVLELQSAHGYELDLEEELGAAMERVRAAVGDG